MAKQPGDRMFSRDPVESLDVWATVSHLNKEHVRETPREARTSHARLHESFPDGNNGDYQTYFIQSEKIVVYFTKQI